MATPITTILQWWKRYAKPTAEQIAETFRSFRHKDDKVPIADVDGFDDVLLLKADKAAFDVHKNDTEKHITSLERIAWNNKLGAEDLPENILQYNPDGDASKVFNEKGVAVKPPIFSFKTVYLKLTGNDSNDGRNKETPFKTLDGVLSWLENNTDSGFGWSIEVLDNGTYEVAQKVIRELNSTTYNLRVFSVSSQFSPTIKITTGLYFNRYDQIIDIDLPSGKILMNGSHFNIVNKIAKQRIIVKTLELQRDEANNEARFYVGKDTPDHEVIIDTLIVNDMCRVFSICAVGKKTVVKHWIDKTTGTSSTWHVLPTDIYTSDTVLDVRKTTIENKTSGVLTKTSFNMELKLGDVESLSGVVSFFILVGKPILNINGELTNILLKLGYNNTPNYSSYPIDVKGDFIMKFTTSVASAIWLQPNSEKEQNFYDYLTFKAKIFIHKENITKSAIDVNCYSSTQGLSRTVFEDTRIETDIDNLPFITMTNIPNTAFSGDFNMNYDMLKFRGVNKFKGGNEFLKYTGTMDATTIPLLKKEYGVLVHPTPLSNNSQITIH